MTRARRRSAPFVVAVTALALTACGGEAPPQVDPSSATTPTSTPTPTSEEANRPEQRQLTADEVAAALPTKEEGPYPPGPEVNPAGRSTDVTDPESCLALVLDTPEMRTFKKEHMVAGGGQGYLQPRDVAAPQMAVILWSHDEVYPKRFFDEAGAALAECTRYASADSPDDAMGEDWQAESIPTPAMGDQSFGVRIGREQFDMA
ncbi:MAG: hypothetical protein L0G89_12175, partial [Janibacter sp.]|nr:hypothetical protein [Janibacter sp.]